MALMEGLNARARASSIVPVRARSLLFLGIFTLAGCGSSSDGASADGGGLPGDDSSSSGGDSVVPGSDTATSSDTSGGGVDTSAPHVAFCQQACSAPADCGTTSAAFDADNYDCTSSLCVYKGCNTDAECTSTFASSAYGCRTIAGAATKTCVHLCSAPSDCATASAAFDADNYACDSGACRYLGCNTDAECASSFSSPAYVCRDVPLPGGLDPLPSGAKNCVKSCSAPSDCATASAAFDADNYECDTNVCVYKGCNTDAECVSSFAKAGYVCR
jgi:hypothetical protein